MLTRRTACIVGLASVVFAAIALSQAWSNAPTYDEPTYVVSGLTALTRHDLRINPVHPPLAKVLAAAPVLALRPTIPRGPGWRNADEHRLAADFVRARRADGTLRRIFFAARLAPILEAVAAAWVMALLASRLFGPGGAWLPGVLWLLNPFVIGLATVDGIDLPFALVTLLGALAVVHARRAPSDRRVALAGLCGGLAVLTRVTGLLVLPVVVVSVALAAPTGRVRRGAIALGVAWLALTSVYAGIAPAALLSHRRGLVVVPATLAHVLVPSVWIRGVLRLQRAGSRPGPAFLLGHAHAGRWLWFWPASLAVKLPPTTLALVALAPLAWRRLPAARRREALIVLGPPTLLLAAFAVQQQRPIGLRYALTPIALGLVAAAPMVAVWRPRVMKAVATVAIAGGLLTAIATPSLAWTNPVLGPGYRVAADANLDWGQGFSALAAWAPGRHPWVAYFGGAGLGPTAIPGARDLRHPHGAVTGWVAVSASDLTDYHRAELAWLRHYCPVEVLAKTILVYRFTTPPVVVGTGPTTPPRPCPGRASRLVS